MENKDLIYYISYTDDNETKSKYYSKIIDTIKKKANLRS